jgi:excisionase family DNA binding protein
LQEILDLPLDRPDPQPPVQSCSNRGPPFLSLSEAADWLGVSLSTLKRLIAKGRLRAVRIGARRKIAASELAAYVGDGQVMIDINCRCCADYPVYNGLYKTLSDNNQGIIGRHT